MIKFRVLTGPALSSNALMSGDTRARRMQSEAVHDKLLDIRTIPGYKRYLAVRRINPIQASIMRTRLEEKTIAREKNDPRYWMNDKHPRRPVTSSSSWIGTVDYDPYSKNMNVHIGNRTYTVPGQRPLQVKAFLESPSLGRYFNQHYKRGIL